MFLSSYENKIDKKGRVSVPATFRSHLNSMGYNGFISYPSFNHHALEACSQDRIEKLSNTIDSLNPFEDKRDFFATSILSESENLQFDTEGRVSLSDNPINEVKVGIDILNSLGIRKSGLTIISCPSCARQQFDVIETVKKIENKYAGIKKHISISILGCVVNGPGEAAMTDVGITGGQKGSNMLYLSGIQSEKVMTDDMISKVIHEVEKKASELENNQK